MNSLQGDYYFSAQINKQLRAMDSDITQPSGKIVLYQYGPPKDWNIPSYDPHCLKVQLYMKLAGVPYEVNNCNNPNMSPTKTLPMIAVNSGKIVCGSTEIIDFLQGMGYHLRDNLNVDQSAEAYAFMNCVETTLYYAILYNWFMDDKNYTAITHLTYSKTAPFPLNWILPRQTRKAAVARLEALGWTNKEKVYSEVDKCLSALATRIGTHEYFFPTPSLVDVSAAAFLAAAVLPPFPNATLAKLVQKHGLQRYAMGVLTEFFGPHQVPEHRGPLEEWVQRDDEKHADEESLIDEKKKKRRAKNRWTVVIAASVTAIYFLATNQYARRWYRALGQEEGQQVYYNEDDEDDVDPGIDEDFDD